MRQTRRCLWLPEGMIVMLSEAAAVIIIIALAVLVVAALRLLLPLRASKSARSAEEILWSQKRPLMKSSWANSQAMRSAGTGQPGIEIEVNHKTGRRYALPLQPDDPDSIRSFVERSEAAERA